MPTNLPVFIIDDDPAALKSVGSLLAAFQYEVRTFGSAEEFLATDHTSQQGCLLCDVRLPGMNGLELQRRLKESGSKLSIILISGYADASVVDEAVGNGALAVLEKPVTPANLVDKVYEAIQLSED